MRLYIFLVLFIYIYIYIYLFIYLFIYLPICSCRSRNIKILAFLKVKRLGTTSIWALESLANIRNKHLLRASSFWKKKILRLKCLCLLLSSAGSGCFENCINFQIFLTVPPPVSWFQALHQFTSGRHTNKRHICRSVAHSLKCSASVKSSSGAA